MADGNLIQFPAKPLRIVETASAGRFDFAPPRKPSFKPAFGGSVYLGTAWLGPVAVEELLSFFQSEAGRTGDWSLHDDLQAARDGIEPPTAA